MENSFSFFEIVFLIIFLGGLIFAVFKACVLLMSDFPEVFGYTDYSEEKPKRDDELFEWEE